MSVLARSIFLLLLFGNIYSSNPTKTNDGRKGKYFFNLFGYLQGFKLGQSFGFQLAPIFYPQPIFLLPSINQQQSVNVQKGMTEENYQEMGSTIQMITPPYNKIKEAHQSHFTSKPTDFDANKNKIEGNKTSKREIAPLKLFIHNKDSIDVTSQELKFKDEVHESSSEVTINLLRQIQNTSQINNNNTIIITPTQETTTETIRTNTTEAAEKVSINNVTEGGDNNNSSISNFTSTNNMNEETTHTTPSLNESSATNETKPSEWSPYPPASWGPYPAAVNSIQGIATLSITTGAPNTTPSFTSNTSENAATEKTVRNVWRPYPGAVWSPYPVAINRIPGIEKLSITTAVPQRKESLMLTPPFQDDRWMSFAISNKAYSPLEGFKPVAGLYYDGFLHRPL